MKLRCILSFMPAIFLLPCLSLRSQVYVRHKGTTVKQFTDSVLHYYNRLDTFEYNLAHPPVEVQAGSPDAGKSIVILTQKHHHVPYAHLLFPIDSLRYALIPLPDFTHNSLTPVDPVSVFTFDTDADGDKELLIITTEGYTGHKTFRTHVFEQAQDQVGYAIAFYSVFQVIMDKENPAPFTFFVNDLDGLKTAAEVKKKIMELHRKAEQQ